MKIYSPLNWRWVGGRLTPFILVIGVAVCGSYLLIRSHAAPVAISLSVSNGTLSGPASLLTDSGETSNAQTVKFNKSVPIQPTPNGNFYVVGSHIIAPDGSLFFPQGANLGTTNSFDWKGTAVGHSTDAVAWNWNIVRLNFYCTNLKSYSYLANPRNTYAGLLKEISGLVTEYTSKHIVVDLSCFDDKPGAPTYLATTYPQYVKFWTDMATTYKTNPYVWFNPLNEAFWAQPATSFNAFYQGWYDMIRASGAENIIVADVANDGNDAGWGNSDRIYYKDEGPTLVSGKCNIVFGMHNYGGISATANTPYRSYWQAVAAANLAMIIEEYGYTVTNPSPGNVNGATVSQQVAPQYGIGALWWSGTMGDGFSLKANGGAFYNGGDNMNLSAGGQKVWDYSHTAHTIGTFSGSYAASNCASAK